MTNDHILALDGTPLNKELFELLFNEVQTYDELALMLEKAAHDVAISEFDHMKEHSIGYHVAGLTNVAFDGISKAFKHLEDEAIILGINLQDEMDSKDYLNYILLSAFLKKH
jgi:hypothetical protein